MHDTILKLYVSLENLKNGEQGQDLVEYAVARCGSLAMISGINGARPLITVFSD